MVVLYGRVLDTRLGLTILEWRVRSITRTIDILRGKFLRRKASPSLRRIATRDSYPAALGLDLPPNARAKRAASAHARAASASPRGSRASGPARSAQLGVPAHEPRGLRVARERAHGFVVVGGGPLDRFYWTMTLEQPVTASERAST
jgi:hypothetical protein